MAIPSLLPLAGGDRHVSSRVTDFSMNSEQSCLSHEVSSTFNNPNCLKPETLFVPRACLLKGLHLILENTLERSKSFDFDLDFSKVLQISLHFSNISRHFRELVQIAMANVFEGKTITNKHFQSPIFKKFLTKGKLLIEHFWSKSCIYEFDNPESDLDLSPSNVLKLHFRDHHSRFVFGEALQELVTYKSLRHLEVTSAYLGNFFYFPSQLSNLRSLKISGRLWRTSGDWSVNICELQKLNYLEINSLRCILTGLSHISDLKSIGISGVAVEDGLHPLAKIQQAKFNGLQEDCLELLFKNRDNYEHCELSLVGIDIPASLDWVKSFALTNYSIELGLGLAANIDNSTVFATKEFPSLKKLFVDSSLEGINKIEFDINSRLHDFSYFQDPESIVFFSFESPLFLKTLQLSGVKPQKVYDFLSVCHFLTHLVLENITFTAEESIRPESFKYVRELEISNVVSVFSKLPCLFKLSILNLRKVNDFSFDVLSSLFPNLESLSLDDCVIQGSSHENFTVKFMKISRCDFGNKWDVISQFNNLKLLTLNCYDDQIGFNLQLPSSLMNLNCTGYYPSFCDFLNGVDPTCMVSVSLLTPTGRDRDLINEQREAWVADHQSQRPGTCFVSTLRRYP
ncbi:hypothetical protein RCL1_000070 [Eukaryota sp. TZLM3-RCL]